MRKHQNPVFLVPLYAKKNILSFPALTASKEHLFPIMNNSIDRLYKISDLKDVIRGKEVDESRKKKWVKN